MVGAPDAALPIVRGRWRWLVTEIGATYLAREIYRGVKNANATYVEIPSYLGHLAGGPANESSGEYGFVTAQIKKLLAELPAK